MAGALTTEDPKAKMVCDRWASLDLNRSNWKSYWQEIAEYVFPSWEGFFAPLPEGNKRGQKIVDPAGTIALELLAAGLHGMLSNPASTWFDLRMARPALQEDDAVREYLRACRDAIYPAMHAPGAGITTHLHEFYQCVAGLGTAVMWVGQSAIDRTRRRYLEFQTRSLAECCIDENSRGHVDTVIRRFQYTVKQAVGEYGKDKVSEATRNLFDAGKFDDKVWFLHAVWPREDYDDTKMDGGNKPWASIEVEEEKRLVVREGGVDEFPYVVARWSKAAGELYGRSPAMTALADIKMLQVMTRDLLQASAMAVNPPIMMHSDSSVGRINTGPRGIIYWRGEHQPAPYPSGSNFPITLELLDAVRQRIMQTFHVDQLQMIADVDMTATEVMQRTQERMRLLGPILGRMEGELLGPLVDRVFAMMARDNQFPEPPENIQGETIAVQYTSPLATAQRGAEAMDLVAYLQNLAGLAGLAQRPEMLARVKWADVPEWLSDRAGVDARLILDDEEFEAEMEKINQGNQLASAGMAATAAKDGASAVKSLAEAQVAA